MNKFKIGDKVVYIERPDWVFEIETEPDYHQSLYKFKDCKDKQEQEFVENCYRLATQEEIDTLWKEQEQDEHDFKTQSNDKIVCPCCYESHRIEDDNDEYDFKYTCNDCGEEFLVEKHIEITYSTKRK